MIHPMHMLPSRPKWCRPVDGALAIQIDVEIIAMELPNPGMFARTLKHNKHK